jgi:multidrug efflux pump
VAFTGLDFLGGGFRNNAATIFVTQKHWDERQVPVQAAGGRVVHERPAASRRRWCWPSIRRRRSSAWATPAASSSTSRTGRGRRQAPGRGDGPVPRRGAQGPAAGMRADAVARQHTAAACRCGPREGQGAGRAARRALQHAAATLGTYYVNDFNKYGRTWQVLMSADPVPQAAGRHRRMYVRSTRARWCRCRRSPRSSFSPARTHWTASTTCPPSSCSGRARPASARARRSPPWSEIAEEVLPPDFSYDWGGASFQEKRPSGTSGLALGLARSWCS